VAVTSCFHAVSHCHPAKPTQSNNKQETRISVYCSQCTVSAFQSLKQIHLPNCH